MSFVKWDCMQLLLLQTGTREVHVAFDLAGSAARLRLMILVTNFCLQHILAAL